MNLYLSASIVSIVIAVASIIALLAIVRKKGLRSHASIIGMIIAIVIFIISSASAGIMTNAYIKGAYKPMKISEILEFNKTLPYPSSIKKETNLNGKVVLFYKYGCPDCLDVWPDVTKYLESNNKVKDKDYFIVSTRTAEGKELVKKFNITEVPMAIYVLNQDANNSINYSLGTVNKTNGEKKLLFNKKVLDRLFDLEKLKRK